MTAQQRAKAKYKAKMRAQKEKARLAQLKDLEQQQNSFLMEVESVSHSNLGSSTSQTPESEYATTDIIH